MVPDDSHCQCTNAGQFLFRDRFRTKLPLIGRRDLCITEILSDSFAIGPHLAHDKIHHSPNVPDGRSGTASRSKQKS